MRFAMLILFSTETGDAWLLDTEDRLATRIAQDGVPLPIHIEDTDTSFSVEWKGGYRLEGNAFIYADKGTARVVSILGYPATRDHGTSAACSSTASSKKRSNSSRFHNCRPSQQQPNCRVRSRRTLFSSTRATCGSSSGASTCDGNSFSCCLSPCSLKTSIVFSQRACAELFNSPR